MKPVTGRAVKIAAICYSLFSAAAFSYLVLPQRAGAGILVFVLLQLGAAAWMVRHQKLRWQALFLMLPLVVFGVNAALWSNSIWRIPNFLISLLLLGAFSLSASGELHIGRIGVWGDILVSAVRPVSLVHLPFRYGIEVCGGKAGMVRRVLLAAAIALPCMLVLAVLLAMADQVFARLLIDGLWAVVRHMRVSVIGKCLLGLAAGLYLCGVMALSCTKPQPRMRAAFNWKTDGLVFALVLSGLLAVYLVFVIIQFRYLFCGAKLPEGLNYTDYARRGFFELFGLTCVNLGLIVVGTRLFGTQKTLAGRWMVICNLLLCVVTLVLLASSFYRMLLYTWDDGLTRLRLMVFGFLLFEAVGLAITVFYVVRPQYNILAVYAALGLSYYLLLNMANIDGLVAKNQIDRYFRGDNSGIHYVMTLSADAAPQIVRLLQPDHGPVDIDTAQKARQYLEAHYQALHQIPGRWQRGNFADLRLEQLYGAYVQ